MKIRRLCRGSRSRRRHKLIRREDGCGCRLYTGKLRRSWWWLRRWIDEAGRRGIPILYWKVAGWRPPGSIVKVKEACSGIIHADLRRVSRGKRREIEATLDQLQNGSSISYLMRNEVLLRIG